MWKRPSENQMLYSAHGRVVSKIYTLEGELVDESDSPNHWWLFIRSEPMDYLSRRVPAKGEVERIYIAPGMRLVFA